jgi:serine/threonine protein phosphatase PrpC
MSLSYKRATYSEPSLRYKAGGDLRVYPDNAEGLTQGQLCFTVIAYKHNIDWSYPTTPFDSSYEDSYISDIVFQSLYDLANSREETLVEAELKNRLLSAYQSTHVTAEALQIAASLLTAVWSEHSLYVASVGVCRAYLVRNGRMRQLNVDDYVRMTLDGVSHTSSNLLSNTIGLGKVQTNDDIHFLSCNIESQDLLLLCNETFYKNVSDAEASAMESCFVDLDELCWSLGTKASQEADALDPVSLCLVKFQ